MTRVLIIDDEALVRAGLRMILESADDIDVVGEADDGAEAVEAVKRCKPDVVLMSGDLRNVPNARVAEHVAAINDRGLRITGPSGAIVDGLDLDVAPGECVAIVGESGAGKSLSARALLGIVPDGLTSAVAALSVDGVDARAATERQWRALRGRRSDHRRREVRGNELR